MVAKKLGMKAMGRPRKVIKPDTAKVKFQLLDGTITSKLGIVVDKLAVIDDSIYHIKTGLRVMHGDCALAIYLNREVRWNWLEEQPFGEAVPNGRGKTILRKTIEQALANYRPHEV
jgi:hypothetical protein